MIYLYSLKIPHVLTYLIATSTITGRLNFGIENLFIHRRAWCFYKLNLIPIHTRMSITLSTERTTTRGINIHYRWSEHTYIYVYILAIYKRMYMCIYWTWFTPRTKTNPFWRLFPISKYRGLRSFRIKHCFNLFILLHVPCDTKDVSPITLNQ